MVDMQVWCHTVDGCAYPKDMEGTIDLRENEDG